MWNWVCGPMPIVELLRPPPIRSLLWHRVRCNNLLLAVYLSAKCPCICSSCNGFGYVRTPVQSKEYGNLDLVWKSGFARRRRVLWRVVLEGKGRMLEPDEIVARLISHFNPDLPLNGKRVLITTGPTFEAIDPVRFIGNHASGKMGFALARSCRRVWVRMYILVTGPTHEKIDTILR